MKLLLKDINTNKDEIPEKITDLLQNKKNDFYIKKYCII